MSATNQGGHVTITGLLLLPSSQSTEQARNKQQQLIDLPLAGRGVVVVGPQVRINLHILAVWVPLPRLLLGLHIQMGTAKSEMKPR